MAEVRTVVLPADPAQPARIAPLEFAGMQAAVGGWIEAVRGPERLLLLVNEEGLLRGLLPNVRATVLAGRAIVGDVVLVSDAGAEFADAPLEQLVTLGVLQL